MEWAEDAPGAAGVIFCFRTGIAGLVAGGNLLKMISWMLVALQ